MFRIFKSKKDAYITNKIINGRSSKNANTGLSATIDLFKIYGSNISLTEPITELSRGLIYFDIDELISLFEDNKIDPTHESFFAKIRLEDVYGGQPTPKNFSLKINPLSSSFTEGHGKDITKFQDFDSVNFVTASIDESGLSILWNEEGCFSSGSIGDICDFFTGSLESVQNFSTGEENLEIDVTEAVKNILLQNIPNEGFRISFTKELEENNRSYFAKRFASRHAYDDLKHPVLVVGFDESVQDKSLGMTLDNDAQFVLFNHVNGNLSNLKDGLTEVQGNDCLILGLKIDTLSGSTNFYFTGSQYSVGNVDYDGIYTATANISSDNEFISLALEQTGSRIEFDASWWNTNLTKEFKKIDKVVVYKNFSSNNYFGKQTLSVSIDGLKSEYKLDEKDTIRVSIFDYSSPYIVASRKTIESPGSFQGVVSDAFFAVREITSQKYVIPFDTEKGSTRMSSDLNSLFFHIDFSNFPVNRSYAVDVLLKYNGKEIKYLNASPFFKVIK